jgi:hypothetical protein
MSRTGGYFKLVPWGEALAVVEVPSDERQCSSDEILTREQLEELLRRHSIPTVTAPALSGYINSLHHLPGFESHAPGPFSQNPGMTPLSRSGRLGEVSAQYAGLMPQQDLNAVRYNHPIFDLRNRLGGLSSVKCVAGPSPPGERAGAARLGAPWSASSSSSVISATNASSVNNPCRTWTSGCQGPRSQEALRAW